MYILQEKPDEKAKLESGGEMTPIETLKDEFGGILHIAIDDKCYVLLAKKENGTFGLTYHWNEEATGALLTHITNKIYTKTDNSSNF